MSQPLGVKVVAGGQPVAVGTWRWGAYTRCAAEIVDDLLFHGLGQFKVAKANYGYNLYRVMRTFEKCGGVLVDENDKMTSKFVEKCARKHGRGHRFRTCADEDGKFEYYVGDNLFDVFGECCCGHVVIDLDRRVVAFHVFSMHGEQDWTGFCQASFPKETTLPCDPGSVPFARWEEFRKFLTEEWDCIHAYAKIDGEYAVQVC